MEFSQRHQLNALFPDCVYVLHVEDKDFNLGLEKLLARAVKPYGVPEERIVWITARNKTEATEWLQHVASLRPAVRGFDAVICDIKLPGDDGKLGYFGLEVAAEVARYHWPCAVIGLSAFARDDMVLSRKGRLEGSSDTTLFDQHIFNDFLSKDELSDEDFVVAKLARCIVPTAKFVELARRWDPPAFFHGAHMWRIFRELISIAFSPVTSRLPKVLLLGEPGTGKGMLAGAYHQLLLERDRLDKGRVTERRELQTVNCATLVASGEGGRVRLFGYQGSRNATLHSAPGVFERATSTATDKSGFAATSDKPDYCAGGVVFLDEFIEMHRDLQAAVLNALEDGVVYRQDGSRVTIGCHVMFATNASPKALVGSRAHQQDNHNGVRSDLLDRITHVFTVPPLRDRVEDVRELVISIAHARLKAHGGDDAIKQPVVMSASAEHMLRRAIEMGLLTSVRQLQTIADVRPGERIITEGNLRWVIEKTRLLGIPGRQLIEAAPERDGAHVVWEQGDVVALAGELKQAFQVLRGGAEKQGLVSWIDGTAKHLSEATKKRVAADERTWQRAFLRVLCDLGDEGLRRIDVFDLKRDGLKGEKMWTVVVDKLVGGRRNLRELFRAQFKEQSRAVLDRMHNALVVLSAGVWEWFLDEEEPPTREEIHAAGELARAVYPDPRDAIPALFGVLEAGDGTARLRVAMLRLIHRYGADTERTEALVRATLARAHSADGPDLAYEATALNKLLDAFPRARV
jgi:MoxR-like ATPase